MTPGTLHLIEADTREDWLEKWCEHGLTVLAAFLAKRAAFADYCAKRDER